MPTRAARRSHNSGLGLQRQHGASDMRRIAQLSSAAQHVQLRVCASQVVARNDALRRKCLCPYHVIAMLVDGAYLSMHRGNGLLKSGLANVLRSGMTQPKLFWRPLTVCP